eukprot:gene7634-9553_t
MPGHNCTPGLALPEVACSVVLRQDGVRKLAKAVRWSGQLMQASACGDVQTCRYAVQLLCKLSDAADAADVDVDTEC